MGGAENAGLKSRAVPVPRTANETIRSLTVSSMPLNLTVNTEPFLSAQNFISRSDRGYVVDVTYAGKIEGITTQARDIGGWACL